MKIKIMIGALVLSTLIPLSATADPVGMQIDIRCPVSNRGADSYSLMNFGDYIGGYGVEAINQAQHRDIFFKSDALSNVILEQYRNAEVFYNSATGQVSCQYVNEKDSTQKSFQVAYTLTNAKGGLIKRSNMDSITLIIPFGR